MSEDNRGRYRAPALEKGLQVLELLSRERGPISFGAIAERLGRSKSELFRVLQVLEVEDFVARKTGEGYSLTNKLFMMGMERPRNRMLVEAAAPEMRRLAEELQQSCHLVVAAGDNMVVVHRVEGAGDLGFSVRVGYRRLLVEATSGQTLLAFEPEERRETFVARQLAAQPAISRRRLLAKLERLRGQGFAREPSEFVAGITDLSAPILEETQVIAAISIPYVHRKPLLVSEEDALDALRGAAHRVSEALSGRSQAA